MKRNLKNEGGRQNYEISLWFVLPLMLEVQFEKNFLDMVQLKKCLVIFVEVLFVLPKGPGFVCFKRSLQKD